MPMSLGSYQKQIHFEVEDIEIGNEEDSACGHMAKLPKA